MLVRGDAVEFEPEGGGEIISLPSKYVFLHDHTGRLLRRCDFYVLPCARSMTQSVRIDPTVIRKAQDYYGQDVKLEHVNVDIPKASWHRVAQIQRIIYKRTGKHRGHYQHPYNQPVWLYASDAPPGWRVELPDGCIVDARGFVDP